MDEEIINVAFRKMKDSQQKQNPLHPKERIGDKLMKIRLLSYLD